MTKTDSIRIRCTPDQIERWEATAGHEPVSSWARRVLDSASNSTGNVTSSATAETSSGSSSMTPRRRSRAEQPAECPRLAQHRAGVYCKACGQTP